MNSLKPNLPNGLSCYPIAIVLMLSSCLSAQENRTDPSNANDGIWGYRTPTSYTILTRPPKRFEKDSKHTTLSHPSTLQSKAVQPYAYGWFGTQPTPHWYRQFGTQQAYTQWTLR